MSKPFSEWTVLPHGKLSTIDDNLLSVSGELHMPLVDFPRRMTVVRLRDDRLVVFSAIALDEAEMNQLEAFGEPSFLVVPSDLHRMDARIWKDRYPQMVVLAPAGARKKIEEIVHVDHTSMDFRDRTVQFVTVRGTAEREAALVVQTATGTTLVVNDLIWNVDDLPGFGGWLVGALGMTGSEPMIPGIVGLRTVKDKEALRSQLEAWSRIDDLNRIIVSHGKIVVRDPQQTLVRLAGDLAA